MCTLKYIHTNSDCFIFLGYRSNMCLETLGCQSNMYQEVFTKSDCFIFEDVNQICAWKFTQNHTALYFEDVKQISRNVYILNQIVLFFRLTTFPARPIG